MVAKGRVLFLKLGWGGLVTGSAWSPVGLAVLSDGPLTRAMHALCWSGDTVVPSGGRGTPLEAQEAG